MKIYSLLLALSITFMVSACGNSSTTNETSDVDTSTTELIEVDSVETDSTTEVIEEGI